jgi:cytochrome c556
MKSAHSAAQALEDAIVAGADATEAMEGLGAACTDCHNTYRNK